MTAKRDKTRQPLPEPVWWLLAALSYVVGYLRGYPQGRQIGRMEGYAQATRAQWRTFRQSLR